MRTIHSAQVHEAWDSDGYEFQQSLELDRIRWEGEGGHVTLPSIQEVTMQEDSRVQSGKKTRLNAEVSSEQEGQAPIQKSPEFGGAREAEGKMDFNQHERPVSDDFEKWGENAASIVKGTFSAMNDFLEEFQNEEERERLRGRFEDFRNRYPQALTVAAVAAGAVTGGALVWYLRGGARSQRVARNIRKFSRTVPRVVNRIVKRVA